MERLFQELLESGVAKPERLGDDQLGKWVWTRPDGIRLCVSLAFEHTERLTYHLEMGELVFFRSDPKTVAFIAKGFLADQ